MPSLDLLRQLSDRRVLTALLEESRLSRAQIASRSGLSKPTVGESVRRLTEAGVLRDTGAVTSGRGRAGTLYALSDDLGVALAVDVAPEAVRARAVDVSGRIVAEHVEVLDAAAGPATVGRALQRAVHRAAEAAGVPVRLTVVSAADPVDRHTGRLVHLPDAPFLVGDLAPVELLAGLDVGPVSVDNDVNWAARAERDAAGTGLDDFAYLHLGRGLGCALVVDGQVLRGAGGLAGEVAHVLTEGPDGRAMPFTEVFAELGLRQPGSTAIDVPALVRAASTVAECLGAAVSGVLAAVVAMTDPDVVVLGGEWGSHAALVDSTARSFARRPRHVRLRPAAVTTDASLVGVGAEASRRLRDWVSTGPWPAEDVTTG